MIEGLQRILAEIQGKPVPPLKQYFCQAVPDHIDLSLDPSRRGEVDFYGYNLDAGAVTVAVLDDAGQQAVPANLIASPTHYLMTVNISSNGVQFSATAHQLVFTFQTGGGQSLNIETCGNIGQACCGFQRTCHTGSSCSATNVCGTFSISQSTFTDHDAGGGTGGNPFPTPPLGAEECPAGSVATGLQGKSGDRIDNVELLCANLNADGSLGANIGLSAHGGNGGNDFTNSEICPTGQVLIGMYGVYGSSLDRLGGECNSLTSILVNGPGTRLDSNGGNGGSTPFDVTCGTGSLITGIMGRSGSEVDHIGFRCRPLVFKTQ